MIITITYLELIVKTASQPDWADTDGKVQFHYNNDGAWRHAELDNPHNDRERGRTDSYRFSIAGIEGHHPGIGHIPDHVPPYGLHYEGWAALLAESSFHIHMATKDAWKMSDCYLLGSMTATYTPWGSSNPVNSELGWYLLDRIQVPPDFVLSLDSSEGEPRLWFDLERGAFPMPTFFEALKVPDLALKVVTKA